MTTHPVQKEIGHYTYWRNGKRVSVPLHSRTYHVGRSRSRRVPHVRELHQRRSLQDRKRDELTTEPYGSRERWILNPFEWDYPRVDNALEEPMEFQQQITDRRIYMKILNTETNEQVGFLEVERSVYEDIAFIKEMKINRKYQGSGYSNILMREIVNWSDKNGITLRGNSEPFGEQTIINDEGYEETIKIENNPKTVRKLTRYYKQYGFKPVGKIKTTTYGSSQLIVRRPR